MWRAARDRVLVRRVDAADAAELMGLAALVWAAAEAPSSVVELARELGADESKVAEAVSVLTASDWLRDTVAR